MQVGAVGLSFRDITELTSYLPLVVLQMRSDLASSNVRLVYHVADLLKLHNASVAGTHRGLIVLLDCPCTAHIIHRIVETTYGTAKLIPQLHSVAYSCGPPANLRAIGKALLDDPRRELGRDTAIEVPLRVHSDFREKLRGMTNQRALQKLLRTVPIYSKLLDEYPHAKIAT